MPDEPRLRHNPLIDPSELQQLHDQCYSWALTCSRDRTDAEDVLQMTYLAIVEGRARFNGNSSLRTWLFAVIRNQAHSHWRRARRSMRTLTRIASFGSPDQPLVEPDSLTDYQRLQSTQRITSAWRLLPARQRELLDLVFYRDVPITEAAKILGVAVGTARIHYERGKAALKRQLAEEGDGSDGKRVESGSGTDRRKQSNE